MNKSKSQDKVRGDRSAPEETRLQGHWLLAKMGKRVLRPGGMEMTNWLLRRSDLGKASSGDQTPVKKELVIVEFGPGVGKTAELILAKQPTKYFGVDPNTEGTEQLQTVLSKFPNVESTLVAAAAQDTGLPDNCADLVIGEAMLTMLSPKDKLQVMKEAYRILRPGGQYLIHEMGLRPEDLEQSIADSLLKEISRTIKVGARPLRRSEWTELLEQSGFKVLGSYANPMSLLEPKRVLADEGKLGTLRIAKNMLLNPAGRERILKMRKIFHNSSQHLCGIGFVARKV